MSYVLDGIETGMTQETTNENRGIKLSGFQRVVRCSCGYEAWFGIGHHAVVEASLRFHYTHCPKAKAPRKDET